MSDRVFLTAEWRNIAMVNWAVDPALLKPYLPFGTELDFHHGETFCSFILFDFRETRLLGVPVPFHRRFPEINLRFYIRRVVGSEVRRGVAFVRELVPKRAVAWLARALYNEQYSACPIVHGYSDDYLQFDWRFRGNSHHASFQLDPEASPLGEGSLEQFIAEHYYGYAAQRNGDTVEYRVRHEPWQMRQVASYELDVNFETLYGPEFAGVLNSEPRSVFVAEGSPVSVSMGNRIRR